MLTIPNIRTSVENKEKLVLDTHARQGLFKKDQRGRLVAYSGGFTVVFPYELNNETWAFRCWHSELGNTRQRFDVISKVIQQAKTNYLCDFIYINAGINVDGKIYPTTRMRWIKGCNIKDYICKNRNSKEKLLKLADNFLHVIQDMHKRGFAHGDLQHGNIIVNELGDIFLIDYDSFYCAELQGAKDIITGLVDYQHPLRKTNNIIHEKIDYFSELIIYLSILAIAENPSLVDKYKVNDSDRLLFEAKDFFNIKASNIYNDLVLLSNNCIWLLNILEEYLTEKSLKKLVPFYILLDYKRKNEDIIKTHRHSVVINDDIEKTKNNERIKSPSNRVKSKITKKKEVEKVKRQEEAVVKLIGCILFTPVWAAIFLIMGETLDSGNNDLFNILAGTPLIFLIYYFLKTIL